MPPRPAAPLPASSHTIRIRAFCCGVRRPLPHGSWHALPGRGAPSGRRRRCNFRKNLRDGLKEYRPCCRAQDSPVSFGAGRHAVVRRYRSCCWNFAKHVGLLIALAYYVTCSAFPDLPAITAPKCVLLMVSSGAASVIQLPVIGWFSQIGLVAMAISGILGAGPEVATACATTLLIATFLGVVPIGLVWAQFET